MEEHVRKYKQLYEGHGNNEVEEPLLHKPALQQPLMKLPQNENAHPSGQDQHIIEMIKNREQIYHGNISQDADTFTSLFKHKGFIAISVITAIIYIFIAFLIISYK